MRWRLTSLGEGNNKRDWGVRNIITLYLYPHSLTDMLWIFANGAIRWEARSKTRHHNISLGWWNLVRHLYYLQLMRKVITSRKSWFFPDFGKIHYQGYPKVTYTFRNDFDNLDTGKKYEIVECWIICNTIALWKLCDHFEAIFSRRIVIDGLFCHLGNQKV